MRMREPAFTIAVLASSALFLCMFFATQTRLPAQDLQAVPTKLDPATLYQRCSPSAVVVIMADAAGRKVLGSGVILKPEGVIATNYHVIEGAVRARVELQNGDVYDEVAIIDTDERKDIALLKIKAANLPALALADSDALKVGDTIFALGAPRGLVGSFSAGMISGIRRGDEVDQRFAGFRIIQFTSPISPGSSGGPLLDDIGRVIGLAFASRTDSQNINLGIPSNYIAGLIASWTGTLRSLGKMPPGLATNVSPKEILASSKSLCILVHGNPVLKTEMSKKLLQWGKMTLVSDSSMADLILEVAQVGDLNLVTGQGAKATCLLKERRSGVELWSSTKGGSWAMSGYSIGWVGRQIADDFIKFMNPLIPKKRQDEKRDPSHCEEL